MLEDIPERLDGIEVRRAGWVREVANTKLLSGLVCSHRSMSWVTIFHHQNTVSPLHVYFIIKCPEGPPEDLRHILFPIEPSSLSPTLCIFPQLQPHQGSLTVIHYGTPHRQALLSTLEGRLDVFGEKLLSRQAGDMLGTAELMKVKCGLICPDDLRPVSVLVILGPDTSLPHSIL